MTGVADKSARAAGLRPEPASPSQRSSIPNATLWGVCWHSKNRLDGERRHLLGKMGIPALFRTRREAREFARQEYHYILKRPDLRKEPHGWRYPQPIRVTVSATAAKGENQ